MIYKLRLKGIIFLKISHQVNHGNSFYWSEKKLKGLSHLLTKEIASLGNIRTKPYRESGLIEEFTRGHRFYLFLGSPPSGKYWP